MASHVLGLPLNVEAGFSGQAWERESQVDAEAVLAPGAGSHSMSLLPHFVC